MIVPNWFPWQERDNGRLSPALDFLPDFRDDAAYPDPSLPPSRWAWEFLRRSPFYRSFWDDEVRPNFDDATVDRLVAAQLNRGSDGKFDLPYPPERDILEPVIQRFSRNFGVVGFPPNPRTDGLGITIERVVLLDYDVLDARSDPLDFFDEFKTQGFVIALLTKGADIEVQLSEIRAGFNELPERERARPRNRPNNWRTYLRIIDALYSGTKHDDLIRHFEVGVNSHETEYGPRKSLDSKIDRAMFMLKKGYRFINPILE